MLASEQNDLLAALPAADYERLLPDLEQVPLVPGAAIYESRTAQTYVYFPVSGAVSLRYVMEDKYSAEIAIVGKEGVVGISLFMGCETTPNRAEVQSAGYAQRLRASILKKEFERHGPLQLLLLRYTQALVTHITQTGACNRHHTVDQQLCRWLLSRLPSNDLITTLEQIASALGVRRESVSMAAGKLRTAGFIECGRGKVTVLDRSGLEARVCECYEVLKRESDRLLSRARPGDNFRPQPS